MNKQGMAIGFFLLILILGLAGYFLYQRFAVSNNGSENNLLGGDRDEHGCITSAGYSWCELKDKCLRIWEETCDEQLSQEIGALLAVKYNRPLSELSVKGVRSDGHYAAGSISFGEGTPGGLFLAMKDEAGWHLVYDGNGSVNCDQLRNDYGFPDEILQPNFCD